MKKRQPQTQQYILLQIRKNEQVYAQAKELIDKLNEFIGETVNEVLSAAVLELKEIADGEYMQNKRLFEDFKKLNK